MGWKSHFKEGKELVLSSCSKNAEPNANIVISLGFVGKNLLIADCEMSTTIKNLKENKKICVVSDHLRISGTVDIYGEGKNFELAAERSKGYNVKNAILVKIKEAFDLDKVKKIDL